MPIVYIANDGRFIIPPALIYVFTFYSLQYEQCQVPEVPFSTVETGVMGEEEI